MGGPNDADDRATPKTPAGLHVMGRIHANLRMDRRATALATHLAAVMPASASVLDVGAGNGKLARAIMDRRPDLTFQAIDTKLWPDRVVDVQAFDGVQIPYPDASFDVCLISDVLHHCEDPVALLQEMKRVTRRHLVIKDHVANSAFDYQLLKWMDWFGNRGHDVPLTYDYWPWRRWEDTFARLGLQVQTVRTRLGLYSMPLSLVLDRNLHFIALLAISAHGAVRQSQGL